MSRSSEPALVLRTATINDRQTFVGFPGEYMPGVPVAVSSLGITLDEARERIADLGLPLEETTIDASGEEEDAGPVMEAAPAPDQPEQGEPSEED